MILVTGGAGFIGSNFVLDWIGGGLGPVVNVDKLTHAGCRENLATLAHESAHVFVQADVCETRTIAALLREYRPRAIVHFAAETHVDRSILEPDVFIRTNVEGTFSMLRAALSYWQSRPAAERGAFRFVHVSTDEVYGSLGADDPPFSEQTRYAPNSPYAASKAAGDQRCNREVVGLVCSLLDQMLPRQDGSYAELITFVTDRPGHDRRYAIDPTKVEQRLGWRALETLETGLRNTIRWYVAHRHWTTRVRGERSA